MKISLGCDHGGLELKNKIKDHLLSLGHEVLDCGTYSSESCDYPLFAIKAAEAVVNKEANLGILVCTSGEGIMMAANKVKGIRCAHVTNVEEAKLSKMHNNANVMALGAKNPDALEMVKTFLETSFSNEERHVRRCEEIIKIENGEYNV